MPGSMKDVAAELEGQDVEEMASNPQVNGQDQPENTPENTGKPFIAKAKDVLLSDTGRKPLESYNPEDYNLPDTQGSRRIIRATDVLLKDNLETVLTDYVFGAFDFYKNGFSPGDDDAVSEDVTSRE